ncbi:MAG TPA: VCBS repeat-containing protein [Candidatus Sulfotelmatobacter sp.]
MIRRPLRSTLLPSALALVGFSSSLSAQQQIFKSAPQFAVGPEPIQVASGDFNHDGNPDLAVLNLGGPSVSILLGDGKGGFATAVNYAVGQTGTNLTALAIGDVNNDGNLDVVVSFNSGSNGGLNVLLGNGDGTFQAAITNAQVAPVAFVLGDFNGDGKLDIACEDQGNGTSLLLGNGDGTFQGPVLVASFGTGPLLAADFNGDHKLDLAIVSGIDVAIKLGNGDGTFQAPVFYSLEFNVSVTALTAADFNGDGKLDLVGLVAANASGGDLVVLLGNGDGTFKELKPEKNVIGYEVRSIAVGDFNGDGKADLVVSNGASASIQLFLGKGDGTFKPPQSWVGGGGPVVITDFNRDGKLDVASLGPLDAVSILLGQGNGNFAAAKAFAPPPGSASIIAGDFNEDGKADLALLSNGLNTQDSTLNVLLANNFGGFSSPVGYEIGEVAFQAVTGDLNGDHHLDVVTADYGSQSVTVLLGNGDGTFRTKTDYPVPGLAFTVTIGDFNADGKPDVAVGTYNNGAFLLLGNGDGTLQPAVQIRLPISVITRVVAGDFNGDGKTDLALTGCTKTCYSTGVLYMLLSNGDGTFQTQAAVGLPPGPDAAAAADVNKDGKLDLVIVSTDCCTNPGYISVLLGKGDGTFRPGRVYSAGEGAEGLVVADFTLDGNLDIAVGGNNAQSINTLIGKGDGTFTQGPTIGVGLGAGSLAGGDFNGDGKPDLAVLGIEGIPSVTLLLNQMAAH